MVQEYMDKVISLGLTVLAALGGNVIGLAALLHWIKNFVRSLKTGKEEYDTKAASLEKVAKKLEDVGGTFEAIGEKLEGAAEEMNGLKDVVGAAISENEKLKTVIGMIVGNMPHLVSNGTAAEIKTFLGLNAPEVKVDEVKPDEADD